MRVCWNRQTGTFEGRVSLTYEFKSRHSHHVGAGCILLAPTFFKSQNRDGVLPAFYDKRKGSRKTCRFHLHQPLMEIS